MEKYYNDINLKNDTAYQNFLIDNPGSGYLKVRASAANQAYPISGLKIRILKHIGQYDVIFFEGITDDSGMINNIVLPTPDHALNDLMIPDYTSYELQASNALENLYQSFQLAMYNGITVIQDINVVPTLSGSEVI